MSVTSSRGENESRRRGELPYKQALGEFCAALCSGVACLIAFWRMLGPASPNALVPQAVNFPIGQSAIDGKYVYVSILSQQPFRAVQVPQAGG